MSIFILLLLVCLSHGTKRTLKTNVKCEFILPNAICSDMRYNMTSMPNLVGHMTQSEAHQQIEVFMSLVQTGCSKMLHFFLCSMYIPMCTTDSNIDSVSREHLVVPPCREMCQRIQGRCEPFIKQFAAMPWPDILSCDKLPEGGLCMSPTIEEDADVPVLPDIIGQNGDHIREYFLLMGKRTTTLPPALPDPTMEASTCPDPRYVPVPSDEGRANNRTCEARCDADILFTKDDKNFAETWMAIWASVCFVSTLTTLATFLVDASRFRYPERPIVFLALCYALYSTAYLARVFLGPDRASCLVSGGGVGGGFGGGVGGGSTLVMHRVAGRLDNAWCVVIFLVLLYFGMAAAIWWLVLTVAWFLAASRKWSSEAIARWSGAFHFAAWAIPAIEAILVLTTRQIAVDELTSLCYVAPSSTLALVIAPLGANLALGSGLVAAGFASLVTIRRRLGRQQRRPPPGGSRTTLTMQTSVTHMSRDLRKLEKLMAKIGVFALLYAVPAGSVVACLLYELLTRDSWSGKADASQSERPIVEIFIIKIFMSLVVGVTSGMWIWTPKTVVTWQRAFCCRRAPPRAKSNNVVARYPNALYRTARV